MSKEQLQKSDNFYKDLSMKESSGIHTEQNELGYIGLYQMGEAALVDAGYYNEKPLKPGQKQGSQYNNDWSGTWTDKAKKLGINNKEDFRNNKEVQEIAVREYHQKVWDQYLKGYQQYEGQTKGGITLDKSGMIAAAHLVGFGGLMKYINTDGKNDPKDGNGVPCSTYLKDLKGLNVNYLTDKLISDYKQAHPELENIAINNTSASKPQEQAAQQAQQQAQVEAQKAEEAKKQQEQVAAQQAEVQKQIQQAQAAQAASGVYKVQAGDTLEAIAQKNNMNLDQLLAIPGNEQYKANPNGIQPNQQVKLQSPAQDQAAQQQVQVEAQKVAEEAKKAEEIKQKAEAEKQAQEAAQKQQEAQKVEETKKHQEQAAQQAEAQKKQEAQKADEAKKAQEAAQQVQQQEAQKAEEAKKAEEVKQQQAQAETQKQVEAQKAEEAKKTEEAKQQQEQAAQQAQQQAAANGAYKVQQGDTLEAIAQKNHMNLEQLLAIPGNEQYKANPNAIQPDQEIKLQAPAQDQAAQQQQAQAEAQKQVEAQKAAEAEEAKQQQDQPSANIYEIKEGDTLTAIAETQGKTVDELLALPGNEIYKENPDVINPGEKVNLSTSQNSANEMNLAEGDQSKPNPALFNDPQMIAKQIGETKKELDEKEEERAELAQEQSENLMNKNEEIRNQNDQQRQEMQNLTDTILAETSNNTQKSCVLLDNNLPQTTPELIENKINPFADFSHRETTGGAPQSILFQNNTSNPLDMMKNIGEGSTFHFDN